MLHSGTEARGREQCLPARPASGTRRAAGRVPRPGPAPFKSESHHRVVVEPMQETGSEFPVQAHPAENRQVGCGLQAWEGTPCCWVQSGVGQGGRSGQHGGQSGLGHTTPPLLKAESSGGLCSLLSGCWHWHQPPQNSHWETLSVSLILWPKLCF